MSNETGWFVLLAAMFVMFFAPILFGWVNEPIDNPFSPYYTPPQDKEPDNKKREPTS